MTRRHPPLAAHGQQRSQQRGQQRASARDTPGHLATHLPAAPDLTLRIGGDGVVLGVDPHGNPLGVRLFPPTPTPGPALTPAHGPTPAPGRAPGPGAGPGAGPGSTPTPSPTRAVLVGSPACAHLIAYRALATSAQVLVRTARPTTWSPLASAADIPIHPLDATPELHPRRTRPLLYINDTPLELPTSRWTTVLTLRETLTHQDAPLVEHAEILLLQPLRPTEVDVLKARGVDHRLAQLPADVLTVVDRHGTRWGRLAVTPIEHHLFGAALRD